MIPAWVVQSLGENVRLKSPASDGFRMHPRGSLARLVSIQAGPNGKHFATVHFEADKCYGEENISFAVIEPATAMNISLGASTIHRCR